MSKPSTEERLSWDMKVEQLRAEIVECLNKTDGPRDVYYAIASRLSKLESMAKQEAH